MAPKFFKFPFLAKNKTKQNKNSETKAKVTSSLTNLQVQGDHPGLPAPT